MERLVFAASLLLLCCTVSSISVRKLVPLVPRPILYSEKLSNSLRTEVGWDDSKSPLVVAFSFQPAGHCTEGEEMYNYTITLWAPGARFPDYLGPYHGAACDRRISIPVRGLRRDAVYVASLVAHNSVESLKTEKITFYTTDVQRVMAEKGDHYLKIICWFAKGSSARGCHVHVDLENTYTKVLIKRKTFNITQDRSHLVGAICVDTEPLSTVDRVTVYDWRKNGEVGITPISPEFVKGTDSECSLMGSSEDFEFKRRIFVLSLSAVAMTVGMVIILIGILCKIGRLHSHFLKPSPYATLAEEDCKTESGIVHGAVERL